MEKDRKKEIIEKLKSILSENQDMTMFELISEYNKRHDNIELVGGEWARKNGFDLE